MNIEEAKTDLEKQIILWDGVNGIGVIEEKNIPIIEIAIDKTNESISEKINQLINNDQWQGHNVKIVTTDGFKFHTT